MTIKTLSIVLLSLWLFGCGGGEDGTQDHQTSIPPPTSNVPSEVKEHYTRTQVLDVALQKYLRFAQDFNPTGGYPRTIKAGTEKWGQIQLTWTSGFFPATLWQLAYYSQEQAYFEQALRWTLPLASSASEWQGHDVGFLIDYSFGKAGRITADSQFDNARRQASDNLLARFNNKVGATSSWDNKTAFRVIIDNLMNLPLLFDAARHFSDERYYQAAYRHALTTAKEFIRADGSSYHVVDFNADTGEVESRHTHQGLSDDSTWSRGQGWGIYGLALAAKESGDVGLLSASRKMADFYLANLPTDGVPFWDFNATGNNVPKDSSAAVVAAVGLWMLAEQLSDGEKYRAAAKAQLAALLNNNYINLDAGADYLLKHATGNKPGEYEVDTPLIYADFYLVEALLLQEGVINWPL